MKLSYQNCYCPLSGQTGFTVELSRFVPPAHGAERRDLKGAFVLPAFLDPHSHLLSFAISLLQADASRCNSAKELFDLLRRFEKEEALSPSISGKPIPRGFHCRRCQRVRPEEGKCRIQRPYALQTASQGPRLRRLAPPGCRTLLRR